MPTLTTSAEIKALEASGFKAFNGIDLGFIKSKVDEITHHIGKDGIFAQYTRHDISHINQVLTSLNWIIPSSTSTKMVAGDWLMLVLSIYFHDLGMVVTQDEYNKRGESGFEVYKQNTLLQANGEFIDKLSKLEDKDKFLYQEFVRSKHAERVKSWIEGKPASHLGVATVVVDEINKMLVNLDPEFRADLGMVCESHHLDDLDNFKKYDVRRYYGSNENEHVNLHYCAIILRTADLLHVTSDRTPSVEYRLISPSDPISQDEWAKQAAVKNIGPQPMRNSEGNVDSTTQSNTIEITALFKGPDGSNGFFGLSSYISYARGELKKNHIWSQKSIKQEGSEYDFPWTKIDDSKVRTEGFEPKLFEFNLDQGKILQLLVGHTLYNDSTVVVRELVQNAIDAIKLQSYLTDIGAVAGFEPTVAIEWDTNTRLLSFIDNGTGMTQEIIEEHLLKVGSSRYQSDSFKKEYPDFTAISRFGIGILTCFLVADNVEIVTSHISESEARKLTIRNVNGKYLLQHLDKRVVDNRIIAHGTVISLEVRADIDLSNLLEQLNKWIVFPPCRIALYVDKNKPIDIGFKSPKDAVIHHLRMNDFEVDGEQVKVNEETVDGVTVAYGLKYDSIYKEWCMIRKSTNYSDTYTNEDLGLCVEGIRIDFESPGFTSGGIVAIANAVGKHAPKTNVARSNIELGSSSTSYLSSVYNIYVNYIEQEVANLQQAHFSLSWAASEIRILLQPLVNDVSRMADTSISHHNLFIRELSKAKLLLIEKDEQRVLTSLNDVASVEHLWMVDSSLFRSVESLVKEAKEAPTLLRLIQILYNGNDRKTDHLTTMLCGFDDFGFLQKQVLGVRNLSEIKIFPTERRVDLCWSTKNNDNWIVIRDAREFPGYGGRNQSYTTFYIQSGELTIENLGDNNIIECFNLVFILKGTPLWSFIKTIINKKYSQGFDKDVMFGQILMFIHQMYMGTSYGVTLSTQQVVDELQLFRNRVHEYDPDYRLDYFSDDELIEAVTSTSWKPFNPSAWDRKSLSKSQYE